MRSKQCIILAFLVALVSCTSQNAVFLTVGNNRYSVADFMELYQFSPKEDSSKKMEKIDEFVNHMLVVTEAQALGYEKDPVVLTAFETHRKDAISRGYYETNVIKKIKIADAEIRKVYNQLVDQYHLAQIVVAQESLAQHVGKALKNGTPFDSLIHFSLDTLSKNGDIGSFPVISLPQEVFEALKKTKVGDVTDLIKIGDYYYFLKVIEHKTAEVPKFNDVKENISTNLMREKAMEKGNAFTQELLKKAKVEYNQEGLDALTKPDSLMTEADLNTWVVKKYDTAFVYVRAIRNAVQYQYQRSFIEPKQLIDRVLVPDLVYDEAIKRHFDKTPDMKKKLQNALSSLIYQKLYSDAITAEARVDSSTIAKYYKEHKNEYKDKKFSEVYTIIMAKLRDAKIDSLNHDLFSNLRKKYNPIIDETTLAKLLKEEK